MVLQENILLLSFQEEVTDASKYTVYDNYTDNVYIKTLNLA